MPNSIIFFVVLLVIWLGLAVFENIYTTRKRLRIRRDVEEFYRRNH